LHLGSLLTALAGYLQARSREGSWLVRIEDIDPQRSRPEHADSILRTLERFGLHWDEAVAFQSRRRDLYDAALERLRRIGLLYPCSCTRKQLQESDGDSGRYPNRCRARMDLEPAGNALRIRTEDQDIRFTDGVQGEQAKNLFRASGDFIVRRRDGVHAYHLAVVVDDAAQGIGEILRGADLLDVTPEQLYLQEALGFSRPDYLHVPVLVDASGRKLSKQNSAAAVDVAHPGRTLFRLLEWLGQSPPGELRDATPAELLAWAIIHWDIQSVPRTQTIRI
jgi:glutamyl-Q tRNA(Asp) synthetase